MESRLGWTEQPPMARASPSAARGAPKDAVRRCTMKPRSVSLWAHAQSGSVPDSMPQAPSPPHRAPPSRMKPWNTSARGARSGISASERPLASRQRKPCARSSATAAKARGSRLKSARLKVRSRSLTTHADQGPGSTETRSAGERESGATAPVADGVIRQHGGSVRVATTHHITRFRKEARDSTRHPRRADFNGGGPWPWP